MKAMVLERLSEVGTSASPLSAATLPMPSPRPNEIVLKVTACGVCHTELDEIEGRAPPPRLPVVPGHQVVGIVHERGAAARRFELGARVGVGWIHSACGKCSHCRRGDENLCASFVATGRDRDGGYAEHMAVPEEFAFEIPGCFSDADAAPLLCAGAIGYRSLRLAGLGRGASLGLTGFGASGHLVLKMARHLHEGVRVHVFARSEAEREFALELGAVWAGETEQLPPEPLDSVIDTTPVWRPVVAALRCLRPGGRLVINAIRKEDADKSSLLEIDYPSHLWMEKEVKSVANVSRRDIGELLALAARIPIRPAIEELPLEEANRALIELKQRKIRGAKVLRIA
jgi:propanol-preferring alcohol dehydrogenase